MPTDPEPLFPKGMSVGESVELLYGGWRATVMHPPGKIVVSGPTEAVVSARAAAIAAMGDVEEVLGDVEWDGRHDTDDYTCGFCRSYQRDGHEEGCKLSALLARLRGATAGGRP